jgi:Rod binding domain-containing protein
MMPIAPLQAIGGEPARPTPVSTPHSPSAGAEPSSEPGARLAQDFEAAMLAPLMEAMLPAASSAVWGEEGRMWRGLFAAELAGAVARSGGVGLAASVQEVLTNRAEVRS